MQTLLLSKIQIENNKQGNLKINNYYLYRKLKSSPIIIKENKSNLNLNLFNKDKKSSKTNFNEIKGKFNNMQEMGEDFNKKDISNNICLKKNNLSFISKKEIHKHKSTNYSVKKNLKKLNKYEISFLENKEKEKKLKYYLENNNELLLSEEEFKKAYQILKEKLTKNKHPVNSPIAITLGGQPGAGKSNLYDIARKRFSNNIVELDCDAFRIYHPYYKQIKEIFGKDDAVKTNPFVFKVVDLLIEELSNDKYNLIIESSLNSPNSALDNGKNLPPKGYQVELQIMATPKQISWQGTIDRYNKELKKGGNPRAVSKEFHDKVVDNICNSLNIVKKSGLMSNILIYDRNKNCLYDMKKDTKIDPCLLLYCIINGYFSDNNNLVILLTYLRNTTKKVF